MADPVGRPIAGVWAVDVIRRLAITACREALLDYGHRQRPLDHDRTTEVRPSGDGSFDGEVVDGAGRVVLTLSGHRSSMPGTPAGELVAPIRAAMSE